MDTESPVVWPAWCYSGDTSSSEPLPLRPAVGNKTPRRRENRHERNINSTSTPAPTDFSPNYNNNNNNNNHVKNERLSPGTSETTSRSRSATPGSVSHPGTPPSTTMGVEGVLGRNYSDFMRSLAAKYNNTNPNDYFSAARNGFPPPLDPRFKPAVSTAAPTFPGLLPLPLPGGKDGPLAAATKDGPNMTNATKPPDFGAAAAAAMLGPFAGPAIFPPLIDMTSTQTLIALARTAKEAEIQNLLKNAKRPDPTSPLDLSSAGGGPPVPKRSRTTTKTPSLASSGSPNSRCASALPKRACSESPRICEDMATWTVEDVCNFVSGIDICAEYVQTFREQCIDGAGLPLLTEEHLTTKMSMKLGPALKLRSILARKLGNCSLCLHCTHCHSVNSGNASPSPERHNHSSDSGGAS